MWQQKDVTYNGFMATSRVVLPGNVNLTLGRVINKMKNSLFTPMVGYLMLGKTFRNKITSGTLRECVRYHSKNSILHKPILLDGSTVLRSSKGINFQAKNFCTNQERTNLMNFGVALTPSPINSFRMALIEFFTLRKLEGGFRMSEFVDNTKFALEIVSKLLSESRFNELDGLLTSECKAEVVENTKALRPSQRMALVINADEIYYSFPYDLDLFKDGERKFLQILVVYHICKNFSEVVQKPPLERLMEGKIEMFTIYNCRFIKEVTDGSKDQWTINAINLYKMHEDPHFRSKQFN